MIGAIAAALAVVVIAAPWLLGLRRPLRPAVTVRPTRQRLARPAWTARLRRDRLDATSRWIDALDRIARATATGSSLGQALAAESQRDDAPVELRQLASQRAAGSSTTEALSGLATPDDADARLAVGVLATVSRVGGPPTEPIDRAALVLRERRAGAGERAVGAAQSRMSAQVLSALPVVVTIWTLATDATLHHVLLHTPVGLVCLVVGGLLDVVGWRWMRSIVRSS